MADYMKFSEKDWNLFTTEFSKLATQLALHEWEILHVFRMPEDAGNAMACVDADVDSMIATIYFTDKVMGAEDLKGLPKASLIKRVARHEALELLLFKIGDLAQSRTWDERRYESEVHNVIHKLEAVIHIPE